MAEEISERAAQERRQAAEHSDRQQIVAALRGISDASKDGGNERRRAEERRFWIDVIHGGGVYLAAGVAIWAVLDSQRSVEHQIHAMNRQQKVMQTQLDTVQAEQRAWIKAAQVTVSVSPNKSLPDGLVFSPDSPFGFMALHVLATNVGHAPAFNVRVGAWALYGYAQKIPDLKDYEHKMCATLDTYPDDLQMADNAGYAATIFPNDSVSFDEAAVEYSQDDVDRYSRGPSSSRTFQPWFYGCIRYTFAGSSVRHQTGFVFRAFRLTGDKSAVTTFRAHASVPASYIVLEPRPVAVEAAD